MHIKGLALLLALLAPSLAGRFVPFDQSRLRNDSFFEQFEYSDLADSGWIPSKSYKTGHHDYTGRWEIAESSRFVAYEGEKGLLMAKEAAYYAISKKLPQTFTREENGDLVVQFEVKFQDDVSCTGAYIKLLSEGTDQENFNDITPFEVMFGPDICGSENKVHFIVRKEDEETGKMVEHRLKRPPMARKHVLTNLYTLVFRGDGSTELRLNGEIAKAGNALENSKFMDPPLSQPEYIVDKDAQMPLDWDDRMYIMDPDAKKPDDWDEVYGRPWIPDPEDTKPEGWNDDPSIPLEIPDPKASKPEAWLEEEDGEWEPPMIQNPLCSVGCGPWAPKSIPNVKYKGVWTPPQIENPNYRGIWRAPTIKNPKYGTEDNSKLVGPVDAIGFELWTMTKGVLFTNIYVGRSVEEAERIGNETFIPKTDLEWKIYNADKPKAEFAPRPPPPTFEDYLDEDEEDILAEGINMIYQFYKGLYDEAGQFWEDFKVDPALAISLDPVKFAIYCTACVLAFTFVLIVLNVGVFILLQAKNAAKQQQDEALREKAKAAKKQIPEPPVEKVSTEASKARVDSQNTPVVASGAEVGDSEGLSKRTKAEAK